MQNYYLCLGSDAHRWSPGSKSTRSEDIIITDSRESVIVSSEDEACDISEWCDLTHMRMSRKLQIDASFGDRFDLSRRMEEENRRSRIIEVRKFLDNCRNIFFLATFWIVDTDYLESVYIYEFIFEDMNFCSFE
jgi:hypothetical protein